MSVPYPSCGPDFFTVTTGWEEVGMQWMLAKSRSGTVWWVDVVGRQGVYTSGLRPLYPYSPVEGGACVRYNGGVTYCNPSHINTGGALYLESLGVSQSRVRLLGSTCLPRVLLQKRVKNTSWHLENEMWNTLASVQVCVI